MKAAFVTMSLCLLGSPAAIADQVVLKGGEAVSGKVLGDHLEIDTTGGHLSVPYSSVQQLIATDSDGVRLKLIDGTVLEGRLIIDSFNVHQGLYDRALLVRDVQSIRWDPPKGSRINNCHRGFRTQSLSGDSYRHLKCWLCPS